MGWGSVISLTFVFHIATLAHAGEENHVSFDSSAMLRRAEAIKERIRASKAESQRQLNSGRAPSAVEQKEKFRAANTTCHNQSLLNAMVDSFATSCDYDHLLKSCEEIQAKARLQAGEVTGLIDKAHVPSRGGLLTSLKGLETSLGIMFKGLVASNDACSTVAKNVFTSESCMRSYDRVFTDATIEHLGETCNEDAIDSMVGQYTLHMNNTVIRRLNTVIDNHLKSRQLEVTIAEKIVEISREIQSLEIVKPKSVSFDQEKQ